MIGFRTENFDDNNEELGNNLNEIKEFCFMKRHENVPFSQGTYGKIWELTSNYVAKVCETEHCISLIPEITILSSLSHDCVLKAKYIFKQNNEIMFILPKYDCSLEDFEVQELEIKISITKQLVSGLQFLHAKRFLHLDLTCKNILIKIYDNFIKACICDFSLSKMCIDNFIVSDFPKVTIDCKPFENLLGSNVFDEKTDCWSLGVCLFKLWEGYHLINFVYIPKNKKRMSSYEISALFEIQKINAEGNWPPTKNMIIAKLLNLDKDKRCNMDQICDYLDITKEVKETNKFIESNSVLRRYFPGINGKFSVSLPIIYKKSIEKIKLDKERTYINCAAILGSLSYETCDIFENIEERMVERTFEILALNNGKII